MGLIKKKYTGVAGEFTITDSALAFVKKVHMVSLNGNVHQIKINYPFDAVITGLEVGYTPSSGRLNFDENIPFEAGNSINVIYETV